MTDFILNGTKAIAIDRNIYRDAASVCSAAGIDRWRTEIVQLETIQRALEISVVQAEGTADWNRFLSRGLLTANIAKASCEAFLELAGAFGKVANIPGASNMSKVLGAGIKVADSGARMIAGEKTDLVDTGLSVAVALIPKFVPGSGRVEDVSKAMLESTGITLEALNHAINNRDAKTLRALFIKYPSKMAQIALLLADKKLGASWVGAISAVANSGLSYSNKIDEAFSERLSALEEERLKVQIIRLMRRQVAVTKAEIANVSQLVTLCLRATMH